MFDPRGDLPDPSIPPIGGGDAALGGDEEIDEEALAQMLQMIGGGGGGHAHWGPEDYLIFLVHLLHDGEVHIPAERFTEEIGGKAVVVDAHFDKEGATLRTQDLTDASEEERARGRFEEFCECHNPPGAKEAESLELDVIEGGEDGDAS